MLATLNVMTTHFPWAMFPAVGWGIGLFFHFMAVVAPNPQRLERSLERERDRERRRQMRQRIRHNASQLERDVGAGLSALLQAAAQRIAGDPMTGATAGPHQKRVVNTTGSEAGPEVEDLDANGKRQAGQRGVKSP